MEKLKEYLPILTALIIGIGYIKLQYIYSYYKIDLLDYLQLSEIISKMLNDIIFSLIMLGAFHLFSISPSLEGKYLSSKLSIKREKLIKKALNYEALGNVSIAFLLAIIDYFRFNNIFYSIISFLFYLVFFVFYKKVITSQYAFRDKRFKKFFIAYFAVVLVITWTFFSVQRDKFLIKYENQNNQYLFYLESKLITTNKRLIFISKTDKFIILFDKMLEMPIIYPADKINKIVIRKPIFEKKILQIL